MTTKSTSKPQILVYGASGHAKVVIDIVERAGNHEIALLIDDNPHFKGARFFGYRVLGGMNDLDAWLARNRPIGGIVAIGDNAARTRIAASLKRKGLTLVSAIHPAACIGRDVAIGPGAVIMGGCAINSGTTIGANAIINTGATVDHDCTVGAGTHIAPGVHLCGGVRVGAGAFLGAGTIVIPDISIGRGAVIGAGSTVIRNVAAGVTAAGTPCRAIGKRARGSTR